LDGYAISRGISTELFLKFDNLPIVINANATLLDIATYDFDEQNNQVKSIQLLAEKYSVKWGFSYAFESLALDLNYSATLYGPIRLPILENDFRPEYSSPYSLHNIKVTKKFDRGWKVFFGVRNIFNFTPPSYSILRAFDPFDENISIDNPNDFTFDASYMYASFQGLNLIFGGSIIF
jgi:outer membrane receptor for ferrienterochelin and colicins